MFDAFDEGAGDQGSRERTPRKLGSGPTRRRVLMGAAAWAGAIALIESAYRVSPAASQESANGGEPFIDDHVKRLAEQLSASPFQKPSADVPPPFNELKAAQYRDIRFRPEAAFWRGENLDYEVQLLPLGWLYDTPVQIWLVENGKARSLTADSSLFLIGDSIENPPPEAPYAFSGVRLHGTLARADLYEEFLSFQGASYFKAIGRGQHFGLSARGLAINTARPGGEEFPVFRGFWIEKPQGGASEVIVHALLDSESTTGAYRFAIRPGQATTTDVEAVLYPRKQLAHIGIAPLTSMFLHGLAQRRINGDFRPAVHNSEGLAVLNGRGERLWRPLGNPKTLQTSAFVDKDPKGFGLVQRARDFATYEDVGARFDKRPTAWVEPNGAWGEGYVELIEIPVSEEIHDNIVAYWKPATPLEPGLAHTFKYRIWWTDELPIAWAGASAVKTLVAQQGSGLTAFAIDFSGPAVANLSEMPSADLGVSAGSVQKLRVVRNSAVEGVRVQFDLDPAGTDVIELRLGLKVAGQLISENWLYRWTQP